MNLFEMFYVFEVCVSIIWGYRDFKGKGRICFIFYKLNRIVNKYVINGILMFSDRFWVFL